MAAVGRGAALGFVAVYLSLFIFLAIAWLETS